MDRRKDLLKGGLITFKEKEEEEIKIEGKSLWLCCFDLKSPLRKFIFNLAKSSYFENIIIVCILVSTLSLSFSDPTDPNSSS